MKMISPGATSIEMPRNTSIRREPIRNDWNKSRAIHCGCTHNYSAKIDIVQEFFGFLTLARAHNRDRSVKKSPPLKVDRLVLKTMSKESRASAHLLLTTR